MLARIQQELAGFYDVEVGCSVEDFLCDAATAEAAHGAAPGRRESLYVTEHAGDVLVGLYVEPRILETLRNADASSLDGTDFDALCVVTEGVSHFLYVAFRANNGFGVTQLELELQAEVDKYVIALERDMTGGAANRAELLRGNGVGLFLARSRVLRQRLFDAVRFADGADTEAGERYRAANDHAARYARSLEERFVRAGAMDGLRTELRRFYRLGGEGKLAVANGRVI